MANLLSWSDRLQSRLRHEAVFLPKRLVLVTLLLLTIYFILLVRDGQKVSNASLGFVEANLQSKLVADYAQAAEPIAPFAPLRLEILRAKLQDENPNLSEAEVNALVQTALAAAAAPILRVTPTPAPTTRMIVQAAVVIHDGSALLISHPPTRAAVNVIMGSMREETAPPTATASVLAVRMTAPALLHATANSLSPPLGNNTLALPQTPEGTAPSAGETETAPGTNHPFVVSPTMIQAPETSALQETATNDVPEWAPPAMSPVDTPTSVSTHLAAAQPNNEKAATATPSLTPVTFQPPATPSTPTATSSATPPSTETATPTTAPSATMATIETIAATATPLLLAAVEPTFTPRPTLIPTLTVAAPAPTTPLPTPTLPPTPTRLPALDTLTMVTESDKIFLTWLPPAVTVLGYNLYRGETAEGPFGEPINPTPLTNAAYTDTVILDGSHYFYRVTIVDQQGQETPPSPAVGITVADRIPPRAPSISTLRLEGNQIQVRWQANTEADLAGYRVYRSLTWQVDLSQGAISGATLLTTPDYVETVPLDGQHYYYVITAVDWAGNESAPSFQGQMKVLDVTAPAPPTGLVATLTHDAVTLHWQTNGEPDVAGYRLYRATTLPVDTTTPLHAQPLLASPTYTDATVEDDKTYYYVIVAVDANENVSSPSEPAVVIVH